jgi:acyl-coenzyme A synthetase/AMP-(fatty) acid ligase
LTASAPLRLIDRAPDAILFRRDGTEITAHALLRAAHALADALPEGGHLVNLCRDREAFATAFLAALLRGRLCLLTGARGGEALEALVRSHPDCLVATDEAAPALPTGLPTLMVRPGAGLSLEGVPDNPCLPPDQPVAIVFTSGSTGRPVGHVKTWGALVARSRAAAQRFGLHPPGASLIGTVPPQHMYGFETTVLLPFHAPVESWCGANFFPQDIRAALAAMPGPRVLVTTPLQLRALLQAAPDLTGLHAAISATAPLDAELAARAESAWQAPILEIFGATEVGSIASRRTVEGETWTTYPGLTLETGPDGARIAGPHAQAVLLDDDIAPAGPGRFSLLGRRADIVKLGGHRASLAGLDRILRGVEGVQDGIFVVPEDLDQRSTARLLAVVVAPDLCAQDLLRALRGRIDPLFLPRRVIHVPALPRNEMGKLPRERLLDLLREDAA